jgi:hypothetical protein
MSHNASFGITTAKQFLEKLHKEQNDFIRSLCLSARHALNAIITAYHLHEWVWGECEKRDDLHNAWGANSLEAFKKYVAAQCPALEDARNVTNGTKHFEKKPIETGRHEGTFQPGAFQDNAFDVSYLWIDRGDKQQRAEDFIDELVKFWDQFFAKYEIGS